MPQLLAPPFSNGSDGLLSISANTTDAPIDSASTATSGTTSISATNASFVAGQLIMIHQTRGTSAGQWELNKISSYVAGTITTVSPLTYTYTSGAQVLVIEQHSGITIDSGKTLTAKAWNGTVGGIVALMSSGLCDVNGTISANGGASPDRFTGGTGGGFRGAGGEQHNTANQGEGTGGAGSASNAANGNGGGGGTEIGGGGSGGGGGGNGTAGATGTTGGGTAGVVALSTMVFGGAGGGGCSAASDDGGGGGAGGGIVAIFAKTITISGLIRSNGGLGSNGAGSLGRNGGAGAGGSVLIKAKTAILGSGKITATGATGSGGGGTGGTGRIRCEACSLTGTTSPSLSSVIGGQNYCGGAASILE